MRMELGREQDGGWGKTALVRFTGIGEEVGRGPVWSSRREQVKP